jgi:hypothetical protein
VFDKQSHENFSSLTHVSFIPPVFLFCLWLHILKHIFQKNSLEKTLEFVFWIFSKFKLEKLKKKHSEVFIYKNKNGKIGNRKETRKWKVQNFKVIKWCDCISKHSDHFAICITIYTPIVLSKSHFSCVQNIHFGKQF